MEKLQADGDDKAGQHLASMLRFEFIIALVVAEHILSSTVALTNLLQKTDMDLMEAVSETKVVLRIIADERNDPQVWNALYEKASALASDFDILPRKPRTAGRQQHRANHDIESLSDYRRLSLFYVFPIIFIKKWRTEF